MDFTLYWFMFPVSIGVATCAMLSGIGGAALFTPIFLIIFPLLGAEYVLASAVTAIGMALLTETFGFSSGFVGYFRRRLIDFRSAIPFIAVGVPVAIAGAILSQFVNPTMLKGVYGALMLVLALEMIRSRDVVDELHLEPASEGGLGSNKRPMKTIISSDGKSYSYRTPRQGKGAWVTAGGGFLTGMVCVGIGEVVMPQLVKYLRVPIPVAAATSVFIVIVTVASASFAQVSALVAGGGISAVPLHLIMYTVPGVLIGGQIGPRLQGKFSQRSMELAIGILFAIIGVAMLVLVYQEVQGVGLAASH